MSFMSKAALKHGAYYEGICRNATVARWDGVRGNFLYWRRKFGEVFLEMVFDPEDSVGFDCFRPNQQIEPPEREIPLRSLAEEHGVAEDVIPSRIDKQPNSRGRIWIDQPLDARAAYSAFKASPSAQSAARFLEAVRFELEEEMHRLGVHSEYVDVIQAISMGVPVGDGDVADGQIAEEQLWLEGPEA